MQAQLMTGFIPYEIGNKVYLKTGGTFLIENIRMIQYLLFPVVEFEVLISPTMIWISVDKIERRVT